MAFTRKIFLCAAVSATLSTSVFAHESTMENSHDHDGEFSGSFDYIGDVWLNLDGGIDTGDALHGIAALALDYSGGSWDWHTNIYFPHGGRSITDHRVGDFAVISNIDAPHEIRLEEFWWQKNFRGSSLRIGMLALDTEFWGSEYGGTFISSAFGAPSAVSANLPNPSIFPVATLGARFEWAFGENNTFRIAVVDGDAGDAETENEHGFDVNLDEGALIAAEVEWATPRGDDKAKDSIKLSGFYHTDMFVNDRGEEVDGNFGMTLIVDRALTDQVGWFGRVGYAQSNRSLVPWHIETGVNVFNAFNTQATLGLGVAYIDLNENFGELFEIDNLEHELIFEATMDIPITDYFSLQPDLQYIVNPGATDEFDNAIVVGLRGKLSFGF